MSNLRLARKRKAREQAAATAAENRARYGRKKKDKQHDAAELARAKRVHAGHKLEGGKPIE